ncbi:MAG: DUF1704 domain-containing protein [Pseudoxanthomonas suwonensis]|nr:DUF1704 domain-containing protein [Pseudoxanthomonas suwonensis]
MSRPAPGQKPPAPDLGGEHAYRRTLPDGGRVHVDRPLPFLLLAHHGDEPFGLARRIASISAASIIWPQAGGEATDAGACDEASRLLDALQDDYPRFLLVHLHDLPRDASIDAKSPRLEPFCFRLGCSDDDHAKAAARMLREALCTLEMDLREPALEHTPVQRCSPRIEQLLSQHEGISELSLGIPQIHRVPGEDSRRIYPQIYHGMESAVLDALMQAIAVFIERATPDGDGDGRPGGRPHHRTLGRSRWIDAAAKADQALVDVAGSFDFLLGVSPINTVDAYRQFEARKRREPPEFRYRPLPLSPDVAKRRLYQIDLRAVEDPVLEQLFREKQLEIDQQLMLLQRRNTPAFKHVSMLQYGGVDGDLLAQAEAILAQIKGPCPVSGGRRLGAEGLRDAADAMIARYRRQTEAFAAARVQLREDTGPGLMVSGPKLLISTASGVPEGRVDPLLQHEIGVHLLTHVNGSHQGLGIFGSGLANYEGIQEGLGVFAEFVVGGLTIPRLRLLAARVLIVHAMLDDADFMQCHTLLHQSHGFSSQAAFNIVARIFRSGGLTKDAIYLQGFQQVIARVAAGKSLDPFWLGKIAERHVPVIEELRARGMLRPPMVTPEFLDRPIAQANCKALREGTSFLDLQRKPLQ